MDIGYVGVKQPQAMAQEVHMGRNPYTHHHLVALSLHLPRNIDQLSYARVS